MTTTNEFLHPYFLILLIPVALLIYVRFSKKIRARRTPTFLFTGTETLAKQRKSWRQYLAPLPDILKFAALILLVFALARPQSVTPERGRVEGIDIYLALDISGSMRAIDLTPDELDHKLQNNQKPESRFEIAVNTLKEFVDGRPYDRIGMVVFAKDAFLQFPLTLDRNTIRTMLANLEVGDIDPGGTAIGNAIGRAAAGLKDSNAKSKIIILITDGDRQGGNISPKQATEIAKKLGIHIFPILVGRDGDALLPRKDIFSGRVGYVRQRSPVNPELLKEIAAQSGGQYYRSTHPEQLRKDLHDILNHYEKTSIEDSMSVNRGEEAGPLLLWAAILLAIQFALEFTIFRKFT